MHTYYWLDLIVLSCTDSIVSAFVASYCLALQCWASRSRVLRLWSITVWCSEGYRFEVAAAERSELRLELNLLLLSF